MHHHLKTKIIWFGVGKCYQDHWKKIPILVYIILGMSARMRLAAPSLHSPLSMLPMTKCCRSTPICELRCAELRLIIN